MSATLDDLILELREIKEAMASPARDEEKLAGALQAAVDNDPRRQEVNPLAVVDKGSDEARDYRELMESLALDERTKHLQLLNDQLVLMHKVGVNVKATKTYRDWERVKAAMAIGNSGYGAEWEHDTWSSQVRLAVEQERMISSLFQTINIPSSPFKHPTMGGTTLPYLVSEQLTDTGEKIPTRVAPTGYTEFDAKTLAVRIPFSMQLNENSIVAMGPALYTYIAQAFVNGLETIIINGDTTGAAAGTYGSGDCRLLANGLRYLALQSTACTVDVSSFAEAKLVDVRKKLSAEYMGNPSKLKHITSARVQLQCLSATAFPSFVGLDKVGSQAGNVTGTVGMIYGSPVIVSAYMPETLDTAGKDAASTYGGWITVAPEAYAIGIQMQPAISTLWDPETLQYKVMGHAMMDFKPWLAQGTATNRAVAMGVKITP